MKKEFNLKQSREIKELLKKYQVDYAYIFGSIARGQERKESDVDIAVVFDSAVSDDDRFKFRCELMGRLSKYFDSREVQVVSLTDIDSVFFRYVIIYEGKVIYEKNDQAHLNRVLFELRILNEYDDFAPYLEEYNNKYLESAKKYDINCKK